MSASDRDPGPPGPDQAFAGDGEGPIDSGSARLVRSLLDVAGAESLRAILLFGSRLVQASPDRFSAYDLVVVVERYGPFFAALERRGLSRRSPRIQAALGRVLPPSVIAFAPDGWGEGPVAKIMVMEPAHLARAMSRRAPDHFVKGRLVQNVRLLHARDRAASRWVDGLLREARADILRWAGPFFTPRFSAEEAAARMLEVSYRGEVRPEAGDRVRDVFAAQRPFLVAVLDEVLENAAAGRVVADGQGGYRFRRAPGFRERGWARFYFLKSKARATARWLKHVVTFDNWLDYIARKVERRTGLRVEITPWERRLPYLLLWPKVLTVLRNRPPRVDSTPSPGRPGGEAE